MFADHGGPLFIPLLQRRYCWTDQQLAELLRDVTGSSSVSGGMGGGHSFNRIIMHKSPDDGKCIILDGQQRLTTFMILLAALRDALRVTDKRSEETGLLQTQINSVLFPWGAVPDEAVARELVEKEGQAYTAAALIPTYLDRESFWQALLAFSVEPAKGEDRVLCAKAFFDTKLADANIATLRGVTRAILENCYVLLFTAREPDIFSIYERMAFRDAGIARSVLVLYSHCNHTILI
jgi:hypothetical protein